VCCRLFSCLTDNSVFSTLIYEFWDCLTYSKKSTFAFTVGVYGGYNFTDKLALVAELDFFVNQGLKLDVSGWGEDKYTYNSVDIPVLIRYEFINKSFVLGVAGGPYLSIPFGLKWTCPGGCDTVDSGGVVFGVSGGLFAAYPLGAGRIIGDLRFMTDFMSAKWTQSGVSQEILTRRAITLTVGYELAF